MDEVKGSPSEPVQGDPNRSNIIEKTIGAIGGFIFGYLHTVWVFIRSPLKKAPEILDEDGREQGLPPYSFLFVCCSIYYLTGERCIRAIEHYLGAHRAERLKLFADLSQGNYSLQTFAFKTAPVIAIIILGAHIAAAVLGFRNDVLKRKLRAALCYLSGYTLLLTSLVTSLLVYQLQQMLLVEPVPVPTKSMLGVALSDIVMYASLAIAVCALIGVLVLVFSFARATHPRVAHANRSVATLMVRSLVILLVVAACISASASVTGYQIKGRPLIPGFTGWDAILRENLTEERLAAAAVIAHDKQSAERKELPLSVVVSNYSDETIILLTFLRITVHTWVNSPRDPQSKYGYRFIPASVRRFIVLKPSESVTIDGVLVRLDEDLQAWLGTYKKSKIGMNMFFAGLNAHGGFLDGFEISVANKYDDPRKRQLFVVGFEQAVGGDVP